MSKIKQPKSGDDGCQLKPPRLFAWLASGVTVSLIVVSQFLPRGGNSVLRGMGVSVLLLAGVFIFCPFYLLARHGGQSGPSYMQTAAVVDRGLYAAVRHPQYLGYILLACGFAMLSQHGVSVFLAVIAAVLFYGQAVQEEKACLAEFGEPYARYCRRVPRFNIALGLFRLLQGGNRS
jgi:protein-S-isoprenylcysteine O-methyltransferase Ste14